MTTGTTRATFLVLLLTAACLTLASCSEETLEPPGRDTGPVFDAPSSVLGQTGVDVNFGFEVSDPEGDAIDSVWVEGAYDSLLFASVTGVGQLFWRACQPGSYTANLLAMSGTPPLTTNLTVHIYVSGSAATHYINMIGGTQHYDPETLVVRAGESVAWRNVDNVPHDASTGYFGFFDGFTTGVVKPGCQSRAFTLEPARSYNYFCDSDTLRSTPCVIIVNP